MRFAKVLSVIVALATPSWAWDPEEARREEARRLQRQRDDEAFARQQQQHRDQFTRQLTAVNEINRTQAAAVQAVVDASRQDLIDHPLKVWGAGVPASLLADLGALIKQQVSPRVAFAPTGGYVIIWGSNAFKCAGAPESVCQELKRLADGRHLINHVSFSRGGGWLIQHDGALLTWNGVDEAVGQELRVVYSRLRSVWEVHLVADGVFVQGAGLSYGFNLPVELIQVLRTAKVSNTQATANSTGWVVQQSNGLAASWAPGVPLALQQVLKRAHRTQQIVLTPSGGWLVIGQ